jgi:two-component system, cell cycle response regulator
MDMWRTKRFDELKATGQLPSPTGIAMRIMKMAQNDGVGLAEVAQVIQGDPALAGRILKLVNSAYYAGARAISAISDAAARLGTRAVWQVALGFSVISNYRKGMCRRFDYDDFWTHSLATAVAAQFLSRHTRIGHPEEGFTCGLLSQIGRLALASIYPEAYGNVIAATENQPLAELVSLEQKTFAMDHRELTAAMLQDWGIDATWVEASRYHEAPDESDMTENSPARRPALLLNTATQVGSVCVAPSDKRGVLVQELVARSDRLGVSKETLLPLCDSTAREWIVWGGILGVKTRQLPPFTSITDETRLASHPAPGGSSVPQQESSDVRALVIDDDPATRDLVSRCLPETSTVVCAHNTQNALRMALEYDPQLIVINWTVGGESGLDVCRALRRTKAGQQVYILILTPKQDEDTLAGALESGANECIVSPVILRVLEARIGVALRVIGLQQEVVRDREEIRQHLAELAVLNRTLEQAALTDPLTGLPNRRYALDRLLQEWASSQRSRTPLTCMIVDLDHFKQVNDTYGHDAGDQVLREVAVVLRKTMRATDVVCRIGGEEFVVICRDTDPATSWECAERLRRRVAEHVTRVGSAEIRMTISIGIAHRGAFVRDVETLLKQADLATYESKKEGRNRTTMAKPAA